MFISACHVCVSQHLCVISSQARVDLRLCVPVSVCGACARVCVCVFVCVRGHRGNSVAVDYLCYTCQSRGGTSWCAHSYHMLLMTCLLHARTQTCRFINQAWHINTSAWRCAFTRHFDYDMLIWPIIYFLSSLCHLRQCPAHVCVCVCVCVCVPSMFTPAPSDVLPVLASLLLETMLPKLYTKKSIFKTLANNCSSIPTMLGRLIAWFDIVYYEIIKGWDGGGRHQSQSSPLDTGLIVPFVLTERRTPLSPHVHRFSKKSK